MEIQEQSQGAVTVLKPMGAIVGQDVTQFKAQSLDLAKRTLGRIVIDASAVAFLDSAGIEALVDVTTELLRGGRALKVCGANPTVLKVLDLTGWKDEFEYFEDVNTAVRSFL